MNESDFKSDNVFMVEYGLSQMEFACADDACFKANFVGKDGKKFSFEMSRAKVMEHVEKYAAHPERYVTNKGLVVAHFHRLAKAWYALTHAKIIT